MDAHPAFCARANQKMPDGTAYAPGTGECRNGGNADARPPTSATNVRREIREVRFMRVSL